MARLTVNATQNIGRAVAETERVLNNAQMLALNVPVVLVDAPGAGLAIVVVSVEIFYNPTTTGYTIGTGDQKIEYSGGVDIIDVTDAGLFDQTTDQHRTLEPVVGAPNPVANEAVEVINETADYTGGNAANLTKYVTRYRAVRADAVEG